MPSAAPDGENIAPTQAELSLADRELKLKELEIAVREREVEFRAQQAQQALWRNPVFLGIFAALIGFMTNVATTFFQGRSNAEIERQKSQSNLIVEAIKTGDSTKAATNLNFFVELGFVDDPTGKIKTALSKQATTPVLPSGALQRKPGPIIKSVNVTAKYRLRQLTIGGKDLDVRANFFIDGKRLDPRSVEPVAPESRRPVS